MPRSPLFLHHCLFCVFSLNISRRLNCPALNCMVLIFAFVLSPCLFPFICMNYLAGLLSNKQILRYTILPLFLSMSWISYFVHLIPFHPDLALQPFLPMIIFRFLLSPKQLDIPAFFIFLPSFHQWLTLMMVSSSISISLVCKHWGETEGVNKAGAFRDFLFHICTFI